MANETRGVFRLRTLRRENVQGDGVDNLDVWLPHADVNLSNYGYYVSGTTDSGPTLRSTALWLEERAAAEALWGGNGSRFSSSNVRCHITR